MYLDLMMDESLDIDVNIEEVDDDRESAGGVEADRYSYAQSGKKSLTSGDSFVPKSRLAKIAHSNLVQPPESKFSSPPDRQRQNPPKDKDPHFIEERLSRNSGDDVVGRNALRRKQHPDY